MNSTIKNIAKDVGNEIQNAIRGVLNRICDVICRMTGEAPSITGIDLSRTSESATDVLYVRRKEHETGTGCRAKKILVDDNG